MDNFIVSGACLNDMSRSPYRLFKIVAYWFLNLAGMNAYYRWKNRNRLRFFTLHGVADYEGQHNWIPLRRQLDVGDFEQIVRKLSKDYQFVSIGKAMKILKGEVPIVENAAVMTFDDGYQNNFSQALPILRKYGVPGVFYVATGVIESREPYWFDRLDYVLQAAAEQGVRFTVAGREFVFASNDRKSMIEAYSDLRNHCKKKFPDDNEFSRELSELAIDLENRTGVSLEAVLEGDEWVGVVAIEDMRTLSSDELVTFGGHTVSHRRLDCSSEEDVTRELRVSKESIQKWTGTPCVDFCYPNSNYDDVSIRLVDESGYRSAVTTDFGFNSVGDNLLAIKRLNVSTDVSQSELLARASGLEEATIRLTAILARKNQ